MNISSIFIKKQGVVLRYIKKGKSRHSIGTPKTCGCQHSVDKTGFNVRDMFAQLLP